ncbi:MAG: phytoene/squalene synthase family protein [Armatimonadetes bacterium]|nr:phytoene/squalene synthase family protein [Armatimonadota bacterium]
MSNDLQASYRYCARVARTRARNFYYGFLMLPPERRRGMHAIYTFMRACDDAADDPRVGDRADRLVALRRTLDAALAGAADASPIGPALRDTLTRYRIPDAHLHALLDGAEMDLRITRYPTFDDLRRYCYRVGATVGLVCVHIFGFREPDALARAEECGIAFQLTNILRDVHEDARMGRIYLPQEDLRRFGYPEADLLAAVRDGRFRALMQFEAERARGFYRRADGLASLLAPESRPCLLAMRGIYEGLLDHLERTGFDVFGRRARLSFRQKAAITARAWWRCHSGREVPASEAS